MTDKSDITPSMVAAHVSRRRIDVRIAALDVRDDARRARRARGYRGPLTRQEAANQAAKQHAKRANRP